MRSYTVANAAQGDRSLSRTCFVDRVWRGVGRTAAGATSQAAPADDPVKTLVARLDLERYKATIKGLTQFGDRRQGTDRNRAAVDWIEAQLQSYGCATERLHYVYQPPPPAQPQGRAGGPPNPVIASGEVRPGQGGSRLRGITRPTGVNNNAEAQPDADAARAQHAAEHPGPREQVYCTKVGATRPDEMYIVGAHMDGHRLGRGRQ